MTRRKPGGSGGNCLSLFKSVSSWIYDEIPVIMDFRKWSTYQDIFLVAATLMSQVCGSLGGGI